VSKSGGTWVQYAKSNVLPEEKVKDIQACLEMNSSSACAKCVPK
jgi:hypothetical protein